MNPYQAYRRQKETVGWTRIDMVLALYDGAIERLTAVQRMLQANDHQGAFPLLAKAQLIITGLASGVRTDLNEEQGVNFLRLFEFCVHRIAEAKEETVADALKILRTLREGFESIRAETADLERQGKLPRLDSLRMVEGVA